MKSHAMGAMFLAASLLTACGEEVGAAGDASAQGASAETARACSCQSAWSLDGELLARLRPAGCAVRLRPDGSFAEVPPCRPIEPSTPPPRHGPDPGSPAQLP